MRADVSKSAYRHFEEMLTDVSEKFLPTFRKNAYRYFENMRADVSGKMHSDVSEKTLTDISNKRVPTFRKMLTDVSEKRIPTFRGNACRRFGNKSFVPRHHSK